jgi:hypothetical protein
MAFVKLLGIIALGLIALVCAVGGITGLVTGGVGGGLVFLAFGAAAAFGVNALIRSLRSSPAGRAAIRSRVPASPHAGIRARRTETPEAREARKGDQRRVKELRAREREHVKAGLSHQKALERARKALKTAQARSVLGRHGNAVVLYEDGLATPDGTCALSAGIKASVQDAGSLQKYATSRVTATRLVTFGVFALAAKKKKTHTVDTRELYLLIETPEFDSLVQCPPDSSARIRQLANAINNAGKQVGALKAERASRITAATRAVEGAERALKVVQAKPSPAALAGAQAHRQGQTGP